MSTPNRSFPGVHPSDMIVNSLFGKPGTQYDFSGLDIRAKRERAHELEDQQKKLKKKVNHKAVQMADRYYLLWEAPAIADM